jgi:nucleotide-binding universal stress UspA family protein
MSSIVVGTDGSPNAEAAVRRATQIAKGTGAVVHLVTAYPDSASFGERIISSAKRVPIDLREVAEGLLARAGREVESEGVQVVTDARAGEPAQVIVEVAQEQNADVIVVGARGLTGFERFLLGSVSSKLAHHAPCDVMIVRDNDLTGRSVGGGHAAAKGFRAVVALPPGRRAARLAEAPQHPTVSRKAADVGVVQGVRPFFGWLNDERPLVRCQLGGGRQPTAGVRAGLQRGKEIRGGALRSLVTQPGGAAEPHRALHPVRAGSLPAELIRVRGMGRVGGVSRDRYESELRLVDVSAREGIVLDLRPLTAFALSCFEPTLFLGRFVAA